MVARGGMTYPKSVYTVEGRLNISAEKNLVDRVYILSLSYFSDHCYQITHKRYSNE